jgi:hypothetical protein
MAYDYVYFHMISGRARRDPGRLALLPGTYGLFKAGGRSAVCWEIRYVENEAAPSAS